MPKGISIMTLIQMVLIVYMILGLAVQIKARYNVGENLQDGPPSLARTLRDYAPTLFLVPVAWSIFAFRRWKRNGTDLSESGVMLVSGTVVLGAFVALAVLGTISVWRG